MHEFNRRRVIWTAALAAATLLVFICRGVFMNRKQIEFQLPQHRESPSVLKNPYCGFYHLLRYTPQDPEDDSDMQAWIRTCMEPEAGSLVLLEINLKEYSSSSISPSGLAQIDALFSAASQNRSQLIVRFLYDWDGRPDLTEPDDLRIVREHICQLADVINRHTDCVFILQGCLTGAYGEMHDGRFSTPSMQKELIRLLAEKTDPSIFLAVRTPWMQRTFTETELSVTSGNAFSGTLQSRLGLFNDGMFGSGTDLGTYAEPDNSGESDPSGESEGSAGFMRPWSRPKELDFQNRLCTYLPNGGEAVYVTSYGAYPSCIRDLMQMHVSFLNSEYDPNLLRYWKENNCSDTGQFLSSSLFDNVSVYDYIAAHLGYRYSVTSCRVRRGFLSGKIRFDITLRNTGFSSAYRQFLTTLSLKNTADGTEKTYDIPFDNRYLPGNGAQKTLSLSIPSGELPEGTWEVCLKMKDPATGRPIQLDDGAGQE